MWHQMLWCLVVIIHPFEDVLCAVFSSHIQRCLFVSFRPSVLDNFALLSGQLNTINKLLKNEKTPSFRNQVIIPLLLSPDRDEDLAVSIRAVKWHVCFSKMSFFKVVSCLLLVPPQKLTEQRVPVFSHEIVPDYLRTKPDPEVEEQEKQLSAEAARIGPEVAQVSWLLYDESELWCYYSENLYLHFFCIYIYLNRSRSRRWISCVPICWRSWTILARTEMQKVQVCWTVTEQHVRSWWIKVNVLTFMTFFQQWDRTNRPSTPLTLTRWLEQLHSERGFLNVGLRAQWPLDTQDKDPWWAAVQPYSKSPLVAVQASKQVWEDLWHHSSKDSQVGDLESWVSISPDHCECMCS